MVGFERPSNTVVKNTTDVGKKAEEAVCKKLEEEGHFILMRNWKSKINFFSSNVRSRAF
jgi:hypothetical protein